MTKATYHTSKNSSQPGFSVHGISQERILEWGSCTLLPGIFPTERSNPGLLHWQQILYHLISREAQGAWIKPRKNINLQGKIKPKRKIINYTWIWKSPICLWNDTQGNTMILDYDALNKVVLIYAYTWHLIETLRGCRSWRNYLHVQLWDKNWPRNLVLFEFSRFCLEHQFSKLFTQL